MVAAEMATTDKMAAEVDLLIEKRRSLEQIRHHRVSWTRMILAVPAVLFGVLVAIIFLRSGLDWPVLVTFTVGTFSCILAIYGSLIKGLYRVTMEDHSPPPVANTVKGRRKARNDPENP